MDFGGAQMATILEVAKKAGVSKATVSRVLSGSGYVSEEKRALVDKAIAETGYRPNLLAPYTVPSLSSMKMPVTEMIQETINRLLSMLDGGELSKRPSFPASLIERESVAAGPYRGKA